MAAVKRLLKDMETRTLVWLAKSRMSSLVIVGTLAAAGLGTAALGGQSSRLCAATDAQYVCRTADVHLWLL